MAGEISGTSAIRFWGRRSAFALILLRYYVLLVPTIGLYRFWLTTARRRFYWGHTDIGGDTLEYTGGAGQLLVGFLMALVVFVPVYGLFFYLSTQSASVVIIGYGAAAVLLWFLFGYARYRARDFRLSRTLWRGIRFDQAGSAWVYALRRFLWSILTLVTLGLAYPFMAADLWSYRYANSWYGDRKFGFAGSWKHLALPFYLAWAAMAAIVVWAIVIAEQTGLLENPLEGDPAGYFNFLLPLLAGFTVVTFYRAAEISRMFSAVRLGDATLTLRFSGLRLFWQYVLFAIALVAAYILLALGGFVVLTILASEAFAGYGVDFDLLLRAMQSSTITLLAIIFGYLLLFGAFTYVHELFLGYGFWHLLANSASIAGLDTLSDVRARAEDKALAGEGLADALNIGGY
ncbi:DUF898 family protein [Devosia sp. FJ2-5-3]|uniref:DUF898 family protein n=1 Tax=Devosia sp. FJ2-5-3 TaxID=2976680 RepID=UPI0023D88F33|nr:DUF898 family protein [Devosia sp. FJ2-5-3]WEJ57846.1 YjgN family protein [Devosia sp. FJ2-5-3]